MGLKEKEATHIMCGNLYAAFGKSKRHTRENLAAPLQELHRSCTAATTEPQRYAHLDSHTHM